VFRKVDLIKESYRYKRQVLLFNEEMEGFGGISFD